MSQTSEAKPDVMVKRDWLNIQDSNNGNYQGQQSVIDTSQLANSNKYMSYREAYLSIPMVMTATSGTATSPGIMAPATAASSVDMAFGLKNWTGSLIHSLVLDLAGTTIVQQTPLCSLWQSFVLMTTLSTQDVVTNGAQMGFYPDDALAWQYNPTGSAAGLGVCNNNNSFAPQLVTGSFSSMRRSNVGIRERQNYFVLDPDALAGGGASGTYSSLLSTASMNQLYKSYIFTKVNPDGAAQVGVIQYAIQGILQLKHMHNFFQQVPLVKGLFFRLTLNLNQPSVIVSGGAGSIDLTSVSAPLGGLSQIMIASAAQESAGQSYASAVTLTPNPSFVAASSGGTVDQELSVSVLTSSSIPSGSSGIDWTVADTITVSLSVGNKVLNAAQSGLAGVANSPLNQSVFLYVPAYTFNPTFEEAYLGTPTKSIIYTDIYQYPTSPVAPGSNFNFLITNGIANIKSVICLPFFSQVAATSTVKPYQSPFDPAGAGPTSPLALIGNFNVAIAGQNMIYNTQKYSFEQFMNQLQGVNAVNGDLIDGLTSSLVDKLSFEQEYCYYYVNASRMLPVDQAVPKSVQIQGQNMSTQEVQYIVFVEYGVQVSIDVLTGSRV